MMIRSLALLLLFSSPVFGADKTWPQWRGPHRDGKIQAAEWPDSLQGEQLKEAWRVKLGPSYSGPIVSADRVFVTETKDKQFEVVKALDRATGDQIWETQWEGSLTVPFFAKSNGDWIRSTPALDGDCLYVAGMRDVLVCLNASDGKVIWRKDFVEELKSTVPGFGCVCSPLVLGDYVFIQAGGGFLKLDKHNGKIIWNVLSDGGGTFGSAFSSPSIATIDGRAQILVQTRTHLAAVDADNGKVLWRKELPAFRGMNILTPTVVDGAVFASSYGGKTMLFKPQEADGDWQVTDLWTNKVQAYMSSPVVIEGHAYLHLRNQRFTCIDLKSGESRWTTTPFGKYWSMVANGSKILALDEKGELLLINATAEKFDLLDRRQIAEDAWAHIAVCDNQLFVRELNAMVIYTWK